MLPVMLLLPGMNVHAQGGAWPLHDGAVVSRLLPADSIHTYTLATPEGLLVRLHIEPFPGAIFFRILDGSGAAVTDAAAWCSYEPPCIVPVLVQPEYRVEVRSATADYPQWRDDYPKDAGYRLRLELGSARESAAMREQLPALLAWTRTNAHALKAVTAGHPTDDLQPLRSLLADARVVGLGEATHGSRDFFQLKHRLLEFLVQELGFTHFAMEVDQGAARAIDEFVAHGRGTSQEALEALRMWQWDTEEVAAILDWVRDHNRDLPEDRKVRFAGFDFQVNERGREDVVSYLRRAAPARAVSADSVLAPLAEQPDTSGSSFVVHFYGFTPEQKAATKAAVRQLLEHFVAQRNSFVESTSATEYEQALQALRRMVQFTDAHSRASGGYDDPESGLATRDRYMAENVMALLESAGLGAMVVIWSHNGHIAHSGYRMGHYLRESLGDRYYAFGLAFDRGGFRAMDITQPAPYPIKEFEVGHAVDESVGWYLKQAGIGDMFVDFRGAPDVGPVADWLRRLHPLRSIGNGYVPNPLARSGYGWPPVVPADAFDGFFFVEQVTPARGNTRPPR
jgi:erythromycin esterase